MTSKAKKTLEPLPLIKPRNERQTQYLKQLQTEQMVFGIGPAGTGKTFLAAAIGASWLEASPDTCMVIIRPTVTVEDEDLGALPGGLDEKMDPYVRPVIEELCRYAGRERYRKWVAEERIEALPVAYIRGRTLEDSFVHVTEAQNLTLVQAEAVVTRIGANSMVVIEGDPNQTDLTVGSCCEKLMRIAAAAGIPHGVTRFTSEDVVRSPLVRRWVKAFEQEKKRAGACEPAP